MTCLWNGMPLRNLYVCSPSRAAGQAMRVLQSYIRIIGLLQATADGGHMDTHIWCRFGSSGFGTKYDY